MDNPKRDPEELLPHEDKSRDYRAMRGKRYGGPRVLFIQFVPNVGTHKRRLPLSSLRLMDLANDGSEIILEFSDQTVVVTGRNLAPVEDGIATGWVAAVEAFNPAVRTMPTDSDIPFIERIAFYPAAKPEAEQLKPRGKPRLVKTDAEPV